MNQSQDYPTLKAKFETIFDPFVQQVIESFAIPGVAVGIVKDGELLYAKGFGVRNVITGEPITPHSLFHLASVSKPFVATAIMQLVERGQIALDAPIITYLPYFRLKDPRYQDITVQQMLSHISGMPDTNDYRWYDPEEDDAALERYVRSLTNEELIAIPGTTFAYSNIAFEVLGDVIAKVSGQTFEAYVKRHILDPLAMHNSTFLRRDVPPHLDTTPHFGAIPTVIAGVYPYHRAHAPSSTLHSSVEELSHWAIANLNRGSFSGTSILTLEAYSQLWHPYIETSWGEAVGLSWFLGTHRDRRVIRHDGSDPGFGSELLLVPEENAAVVVLANSNTAPIGSLSRAALDIVFGLAPQMPKSPITVPIAATLAREGEAAASALYEELLMTEPDRYDASPARFSEAVWGAIEVHQPHVVIPLLQVWIAVQPESSEAHEMLGWAYSVSGEPTLATTALRQALTLDPENENAQKLLSRITL